MFCPSCGTEVENGALFCQNCGTVVDNAKPEEKGATVLNGEVINTSSNSYSNNNETTFNQSTQNAQVERPEGSHPSFALWLTLSIINLLCCCQIMGIIALVFTIIGNNAYTIGNYSEADSKMNTAKILNIIGMIVGFFVTAIYLIFFFAGMASEF